MDNMVGIVVVVVVGSILAAIGVTHIAMDFRHFDEIEKQCKDQGYIQNKTVRIKCQKEAP